MALIIIGIAAGLVGIPVLQSSFAPGGSRKTALMMAELSRQAQSLAVETGRLTVQEIDLAAGSIDFYFLDEDGARQAIGTERFQKRSLQKQESFSQAELHGVVLKEGTLLLPYFPAGYGREAMLVLRDHETNQEWSLYYQKFYGEVQIYNGIKSLAEVQTEEN